MSTLPTLDIPLLVVSSTEQQVHLRREKERGRERGEKGGGEGEERWKRGEKGGRETWLKHPQVISNSRPIPFPIFHLFIPKSRDEGLEQGILIVHPLLTKTRS